ncbi:MAG: trypsin-like peptidase domain-containing protein [Methanobrevibacter sp.]|nr:trypsin-like peptidase domain-containing protein [Methanobrevibacter sp.]
MWKFNYVEQYGTGFLFKENYIITNFHIVENSEKIEVKTYMQNEYETAEIIGFDKINDICVLKSSKYNSNILKFSSNKLNEGEIVITIGMPYGLDYTSTIGIISSLNHSIRLEDNSILNDVIQTNMKLHPGNSGGPLVNLNCTVIGMNTMILNEYDNISFALKIDYVIDIAEKIIKGDEK